jgi:hypothetical protein
MSYPDEILRLLRINADDLRSEVHTICDALTRERQELQAEIAALRREPDAKVARAVSRWVCPKCRHMRDTPQHELGCPDA